MSRRPPWALRSTPARSAWRSPDLRSRFFSRRIDRRAGNSGQPVRAGDSDRAAGRRAGPHDLHHPAHRPGALHGVGLHADARLSRRGMQRDGRGRRVRGLHHRQCRQQPDRPADLGRRRRSSRACRQFLFLRGAQSRRRGAGLFHHPLDHAASCDGRRARRRLRRGATHLRNPPLRAAFGIGFCILFAFIGTFTYVNFVLVREPLSLAPMALGLVYFVFLPSILTTPFAGAAVQRFGTRPTFWAALALALARTCRCCCCRTLPAVLARLDAGRHRHLLRAGGGHRLRRPRRHHRPRLGERHLSRLAISSAASSAARCSGSCSIASAGTPASSASRLP